MDSYSKPSGGAAGQDGVGEGRSGTALGVRGREGTAGSPWRQGVAHLDVCCGQEDVR